jgi:hypothetical protein
MALNKKLASALLFGLSTALAGTAQAVDITLSSAMGAVGGSVMVTFDYAAMDADDTAGFQFDIMFDDVALTATDFSMCGANAPASSNLISCTNPSPGLLRVLIGDIAIPVEEIMPLNIPAFGNFTFMINQPGTHALTFTNASASDIAGGGVAINGMDGSISGAITGASGFASAPAPGSTIDLGSVDVGAASAAMNITVSEIGDMTLDVTAVAITGANAGDFASATAPFMIADGGADVMVDVNCSPTSRGALTGTLELTNNSVNDPTPQYTLNCAGLAPNVAVSSMTVNMAGVIGGTNPTASFDVTNAQDGFTNDATMATVVDGATAEITVTNALPGTLPVDSTNAVDLMCDATNAGMFTDTVSVQYFDPVAGATAMIDVTVNCDIANAFPVYESVPSAGSTLDFMGVPNGGSGGPLGVDVGNTMAVGGAALNVTAAAITGADAAQFTLGAFAPFSVAAGVGPDGTDDITVTCDPTSAGVFAAMLVVNTDDPAEPAGGFTYPLACTGTVNSQFSSNPAPGAVSFGIVAPGSSVDTIITMSNGAGAADDLTIDCALDPLGAPEITLVSPVFPQTVVPGASVDVTLNCSTTTPATVTGTLSCSTNDPNNLTVTYDLTCIGQPLIVPTLSQWGLLAMALLMMFGGVIAFRLRQN